MALVITLILLALITTLAIAFLALTHRETGAVDSMARTTDAEEASESALERAKAQIIAPFPFLNAVNNGTEIMGPDLTVSVCHDTNWLKPSGMFLDPSPPVFINTNRADSSGPFDNRFYLDLNRNAHFEETGYVPLTDNAFAYIPDSINWVVGDPQWIGILQDPIRPHLPDNRFIARYAFLIQPVGRSLDVNWIHNQALQQLDMRIGQYNGFYRNQGLGPWELNLGAFLADLNSNYWGGGSYDFDPFNTKVPNAIATGLAFEEAREFLRYRYTPPAEPNISFPPLSNQSYLDCFTNLFPGTGPGSAANLFASDFIDGYANTFVTPFGTTPQMDDDDPTKPWPGADGKRHFFSIHDLFDETKLPGAETAKKGFRFDLADASARGNSYDRYTYYRMLAQLGTVSAPEEEGKININYVTIPSWSNPNFRFGATNLVPWSRTDPEFTSLMGRPGPELFFLTAATNLLARETNFAFMVTNATVVIKGNPLRIPIFTNGSTTSINGPVPGPLYAGRIHQILQLAANIHDATTGPKDVVKPESLPYYPSVFRPQFEQMPNGDVYITNYVLMTEKASDLLNDRDRKWHDLDSRGLFPTPVGRDDQVYGIPLIIGARKGYPNFNEFALMTSAEAVRRLEIFREVDGAEPKATNQTFIMRITNQVWFEARNSYQSNYPRRLDLIFGIRSESVVTNSFTRFPWTNWATGYQTNLQAQAWPGEKIGQERPAYQVGPLFQQAVLNFTNISRPDPGGFTNQWGCAVTNRMLFFLVDHDSDRIVDAVSLNGPRNFFDVGTELGTKLPWKKDTETLGQIWSNARDKTTGTSLGVSSQITISSVDGLTTPQEWNDFSEKTKSKADAIAQFIDFMKKSKKAGTHQVPFTAGRRMFQTNYFRVNDPLVHYTMEDLVVSRGVATLKPGDLLTPVGLGSKNPECIPWNNGLGTTSSPGGGATDPTLLDPGVINSDAWDFPTNAFPNVGWLGRVHRGTPWQTIYLKSKPADAEQWRVHGGPSRLPASAILMHPTKDWGLIDIFTTAPHPNATRGRLSINQTNLAAWSAALSGVVVSSATNDAGAGAVVAVPEVVKPAALADPVAQIVAGINQTRTNQPGHQFRRLSDVLMVPELTYKSPFLYNAAFDPAAPTGLEQILDSDYERIPQQILSLLQLGEPRFVVYAWGQSLKPARRNPDGSGPSIVTAAGPDKGLCLNYQITGEMATRSVVRVEFERDPVTKEIDYRKPHAVVESFNILPIE